MKRIKKLCFPLICFAIIFGLTIPMLPVAVASSAPIDVPGTYSTIQAAVDAAKPGDTIKVAAGTYRENLTVEKRVSLLGENRDTIIDGGGGDTAIWVNEKVSKVSISGFTVQNAKSYGIYLDTWSKDNTIIDNSIVNNQNGIRLQRSSSNRIINNSIENNVTNGIELYNWYSKGDNQIIGNSIIGNNNGVNSSDTWKKDPDLFYNNNFINNTNHVVYYYASIDTWHSPEEIAYSYNCKTYKNYLGNYWSGYTGSDTDGDGIGDTPYSIDSDKDEDDYPLVERFENYEIPPAPCDITPPDTEILDGPSGTIDYSDVGFAWTGSDDITPTPSLVYSYYMEGYDEEWSDWTSDTEQQYTDLPEGGYTFKVNAKNQAGNIDLTPAERSFTISFAAPDDTTPPDTKILDGPSGTIDYSDVGFAWTGSDDITSISSLVYSYYMEGYDEEWSDWTSDTEQQYTDLPEGGYTFKVNAKDQAGNIDLTPAGRPFTISFAPYLSMLKFEIDHATINFKNPDDDDKVRVQGELELDLDNGDSADISECVTVTVGSLSETIPMVEKGKKGEKWEYKRPKDSEGNIKRMTIDWKKGTFDICIDRADLTGVTNPIIISIQIGDDFGEVTIKMKEKIQWDYKAHHN